MLRSIWLEWLKKLRSIWLELNSTAVDLVGKAAVDLVGKLRSIWLDIPNMFPNMFNLKEKAVQNLKDAPAQPFGWAAGAFAKEKKAVALPDNPERI